MTEQEKETKKHREEAFEALREMRVQQDWWNAPYKREGAE